MESKLRSIEAYFASVTESDIMPGYRYLCADVSDISDPELLFEALKNYVHYLLEEIEMFLNISGRKIDKLTIGKTKAKSKNNTSITSVVSLVRTLQKKVYLTDFKDIINKKATTFC